MFNPKDVPLHRNNSRCASRVLGIAELAPKKVDVELPVVRVVPIAMVAYIR